MQLYPSVRNFERSFILQNKVSHCSIFPPDLSALTLHILAMAFMFCDHLWATLAGDAWWLTGIGRLAFPMFAFFLVEGFFHTHDRKKYCMRLLLLAILSELPINLMYSGLLFYPFHQNVIWTLLTGFLCIWAIDTLRKKCPVWLWIPSILLLSAVGYVLATLLMFDYYGEGVLTVIVFYLFHGKKLVAACRTVCRALLDQCHAVGRNADSITAFRSCLRDFRTGTGAVVSAASVVLPWTPGRA